MKLSVLSGAKKTVFFSPQIDTASVRGAERRETPRRTNKKGSLAAGKHKHSESKTAIAKSKQAKNIKCTESMCFCTLSV